MCKHPVNRFLVLVAVSIALAVGLAACAAPAAPAAAPAAPAATAPVATEAPAATEAPGAPVAPAQPQPAEPSGGAAPTEVPAAEARAATPSPTLPADALAATAIATASPAPSATQAPQATEVPAATEAPAPTAIALPTLTPSALVDQAAVTATATPVPLPTEAPAAPASASRIEVTSTEIAETAIAAAVARATTTPTLVPPTATETPLATPTAVVLPTDPPTPAPTESATMTEAQQPVEAMPAAPATLVPIPTVAPLPPLAQVVQPGQAEPRIVELEWPPRMRLGDSDLVRLALIPSQLGYTLTTEFQGNQTVTQSVEVKRPTGYVVSAIARLDGVGFDIGPQQEQSAPLPAGEAVTWRWTISPKQSGQQRLSLAVMLRWTPVDATAQAQPQDSQAYSRGLNVQVDSILGMTTPQASTTGLLGLVLGSGMGTLALVMRRNRNIAPGVTRAVRPNAGLAIEMQPGIKLGDDESQLLRTLFRKYARVSVEREFRSGYSGARTLLCLPVRADGRSDAYTIAKMGERRSIEREFHNYETFVKDTLPPVTARIQEPPVTLSPAGISSQAVLRYTFIGEPGHTPMSLREALLREPDARLLQKLFDTFGPNWWLQRRPYSFRLSQEYDRLLPSHFVVEPVEGNANGARREVIALKGDTLPADVALKIGDLVTLRDFPLTEQRPDGVTYSLTGEATHGQPPLRIRVNSPVEPRRPAQAYRVIGTRQTLLRDFTRGLDPLDMPDPLAKLAATEHRTISGTQSPIHGDLNLENVLVGPGNFVWLIDFANTRDGHPLFDFARLEAEIITQIAAVHIQSPQRFLTLLRRLDAEADDGGDEPGVAALIRGARAMARHCLFNALQPREYWMALYLACLGALKFTNLNAHQRHLLYLTAAHVGQKF